MEEVVMLLSLCIALQVVLALVLAFVAMMSSGAFGSPTATKNSERALTAMVVGLWIMPAIFAIGAGTQMLVWLSSGSDLAWIVMGGTFKMALCALAWVAATGWLSRR
jgi:hypothetical protein